MIILDKVIKHDRSLNFQLGKIWIFRLKDKEKLVVNIKSCPRCKNIKHQPTFYLSYSFFFIAYARLILFVVAVKGGKGEIPPAETTNWKGARQGV